VVASTLSSSCKNNLAAETYAPRPTVKNTPAGAKVRVTVLLSKALGVAGEDLATSLQAGQSLLHCGHSLVRCCEQSSMFFQKCRLLALQSDLGFKVRNPSGEID